MDGPPPPPPRLDEGPLHPPHPHHHCSCPASNPPPLASVLDPHNSGPTFTSLSIPMPPTTIAAPTFSGYDTPSSLSSPPLSSSSGDVRNINVINVVNSSTSGGIDPALVSIQHHQHQQLHQHQHQQYSQPPEPQFPYPQQQQQQTPWDVPYSTSYVPSSNAIPYPLDLTYDDPYTLPVLDYTNFEHHFQPPPQQHQQLGGVGSSSLPTSTSAIYSSLPPVISNTIVHHNLPLGSSSQYIYSHTLVPSAQQNVVMSFPMSLPPQQHPVVVEGYEPVGGIEPLPPPPPHQQQQQQQQQHQGMNAAAGAGAGVSVTIQTRTHIIVHQQPQQPQRYGAYGSPAGYGGVNITEGNIQSLSPEAGEVTKPGKKKTAGKIKEVVVKEEFEGSDGLGGKDLLESPVVDSDAGLVPSAPALEPTSEGKAAQRRKSKSTTPGKKAGGGKKLPEEEADTGKIEEIVDEEAQGSKGVGEEEGKNGREGQKSGSPEKELTRKRRKIFDETERQKVKQVRQMRACIRCRLNKRSCSTDDCCKHCQSLIRRIKGSPDLGQYICFRHNLFDMRFRGGLPSRQHHHLVLQQIEASVSQLEPYVRSVIDVVSNFLSSGIFTTVEMTVLAEFTRSDDPLTQFAPTLGTEPGASVFEDDGIVPAPVYMQNWFRTIRRIMGTQRRGRRNVGKPWSVKQLFELIHKMEYIEHYYQESDQTTSTNPSSITSRLETDLVAALLSYTSIFLAVKYRIFNPLLQHGDLQQFALYINCTDLIEAILMKATDTLLNRVGQKFMNKERLEDVLSCLEIWEIRYNFGYLWRRSQLSRDDYEGCEYANCFRGMEVGISGVRTALMQRSRV